MAKEKPLPPDPLIDYSAEGVPISRQLENEAKERIEIVPEQDDNMPAAGITGGAHNKKRQGTEDAQKRSDTGTGI